MKVLMLQGVKIKATGTMNGLTKFLGATNRVTDIRICSSGTDGIIDCISKFSDMHKLATKKAIEEIQALAIKQFEEANLEGELKLVIDDISDQVPSITVLEY